MEDNNKDDNDYKAISALELVRDMGFSRAHSGNHGRWSHDDDSEEEDNDNDHDNNKDNNDDNCIVSQGQIETWDFLEDIKNIKCIGLMMMMMTRRMTRRWRSTTMTRLSQLWN